LPLSFLGPLLSIGSGLAGIGSGIAGAANSPSPTAGYQPRGGAVADSALGMLLGPWLAAAQQMPGNNPALTGYNQTSGSPGTAASLTQNYLTNPPQDASTMIGQAEAGQQYYQNQAFPAVSGAPSTLANSSNAALATLPNLQGNAFNPAFAQSLSQLQNNPYLSSALSGATTGATIGQTAATQAGLGSTGLNELASQFPGIGAHYANQIAGAAGPLQGLSNQILQTGVDPQAALFNRSQGQTLDQANVVNAASGLSGTPYGASTTANALGNFDINWQNQQQAREQAAASSAGQIQNTIGQLQQAALGANVTGANAANSLYQGGLGLGQGGATLAGTSGNMPNAIYGNSIDQIIQAALAQNQAGQVGSQAMNNVLSAGGGGLTNAASIGSGIAGNLASTGALGYQAGANYANTGVQGLSNLQGLTNSQAGLGMNAFNLPQGLTTALLSYIQGLPAATQQQNYASQLGFNQASQSIGGGISAINNAFNPNSGFNNAIQNFGNLFSGGGGGVTDPNSNVGALFA
jgi:hypothetical protein